MTTGPAASVFMATNDLQKLSSFGRADIGRASAGVCVSVRGRETLKPLFRSNTTRDSLADTKPRRKHVSSLKPPLRGASPILCCSTGSQEDPLSIRTVPTIALAKSRLGRGTTKTQSGARPSYQGALGMGRLAVLCVGIFRVHRRRSRA